MKATNIFIIFVLTTLTNSYKVFSEELLHKSDNVLTTDTSKTLWHDLITPDIESSKQFYTSVFGWSFEIYNFKGLKYALITNDKEVIGGVIEVKQAKSSTWITSLITNAKEMKRKVKFAIVSGCKLVGKPLKLPGRGKQVVLETPQGEEFAFITEIPSSTLKDKTINGAWIGVELWSSNVKDSKEFYQNNFNITVKKLEVDGKPYWIFKSNDKDVAGMINNPVINQGSQWVPYLYNSNPSNLVSVVTKKGGTVILSPKVSVRSGKLAIFQDPNGAVLCVQKK
ncbi:hypothetical protein BTO06_14530 [Tenacibaculum sp. SZ-18]|uniref:hypothetical protein n=1 Tax=Tenacibaculum sp. SZ-18 TaxID=754423 RepID=UPI000C2D0959|nr:hypothetical protein [Tenacibaculum sp. SZ-18]AUC16289.1 hypothetical protein BTO06_14530 [Tenacibaculum sp. SZ-18]